MRRPGFSVAGLMLLVVAISIGLTSLRFPSEAWAGFILLLTLGALSITVLGTVYRRGSARAWWLGFALLGWGYMVLASEAWWDRNASRPELLTTMLLDRLRPFVQANPGSAAAPPLFAWMLVPDPRNWMILKMLDEPISMSFANGIPLEDALKYIKSATTSDTYVGIQIYVDPVGLREAGQTMTSPVTLDLQGVPLRTTLTYLLRPLGMSYSVKDGALIITKSSVALIETQSFRRIGHCFWALIAGWIGGTAGRFFCVSRDRTPDL